jgi:AbrB family looped-hinge helix DNA binding protein
MVVTFNESTIVGDPVRSSMTQVRLSSKYQIVIPEGVREQLGVKPGQLFEVFAVDGQMVVAVPARALADSFGMFPGIDTTIDREDEDRV